MYLIIILKKQEIKKYRNNKKINELAGIIAGITIDKVIKDNEINFLKKWIEENNSYRDYDFFDEVIPIIEIILLDNIVTEKEKDTLLNIYNFVNNNIKSNNTQSLQVLNGIVNGIVCDKEMSLEELQGLRSWLYENSQLKGNYPYDKIFETVENVLEDNYITEKEKEKLINLFNTFLNPVTAENDVDTIEFQSNRFVITGEFTHGSREEIIKTIESLGGEVARGVSKKVKYVVVGGLGSKDWSYGNFGSKVKDALELKEQGVEIYILYEEDLFNNL
ncbi:MAG: BRCT domain-containing protein [Clostridia bacterium]